MGSGGVTSPATGGGGDPFKEVPKELHREHGELMAAADDRLYAALTRALGMLPKSGVAWAIAKPKPVVFVCSKDTLFQIVLDLGESKVSITSRPLNGEKMLVGLEWVEREPESFPNAEERERADSTQAWWEANWTFRYVDQGGDDLGEWQQVTGGIVVTREGERLDRRERFARAVAVAAGWERRKTPRTT
jgi:hypothetical protein